MIFKYGLNVTVETKNWFLSTHPYDMEMDASFWLEWFRLALIPKIMLVNERKVFSNIMKPVPTLTVMC